MWTLVVYESLGVKPLVFRRIGIERRYPGSVSRLNLGTGLQVGSKKNAGGASARSQSSIVRPFCPSPANPDPHHQNEWPEHGVKQVV